MNTRDRRVHRTRQALTEALISLTLEEGYESISIRDITARADVGYATFFRHYTGKDALLGDVLELVLAELLNLLQPVSAETDPVRVGTLVFEHAQKNSKLYRVLLSSYGSSQLLKRVREVGVQQVLRTFTAKEGSAVPLEVAANHLIVSFLALIRWWLEHDMPYSPARMGEVYSELIMQPTRAVAFAEGAKKRAEPSGSAS
jgi:AcrR family transcriptional regulator